MKVGARRASGSRNRTVRNTALRKRLKHQILWERRKHIAIEGMPVSLRRIHRLTNA